MVGAAGASWPVTAGSFPIGGGVGGARRRGDVGGENVEGDVIVGAGGDVGADGDVGDDGSVGELSGNCTRFDWKSSGEGTFFGGVDSISGERDGA